MTSEKLKEIKEDFKNGLSISKIAQKYQISKNSVSYYAKFADLNKMIEREKQQKEKEDLICSLAKECTNGYQILSLLGERKTKTQKECIDNLLQKREFLIQQF